MYFSRKQKRLLGKIKRMPRLKSELREKELRHLSYFGNNGLIQYETIFESENSMKEKGTLIHIQPKGEAEYAHILEERRRWLIPVVISVAALIISICAIISSSQSINVYIDGQGNSFATQQSTTSTSTTNEK